MKASKRKCKNCGVVFEKKQPLQYVCSVKCAIEHTKKNKEKHAEKARIQAAKQERTRQAELRHKLETVPELTKKAQAAFNRFIRLRDKDKPCISCGAPLRQGGGLRGHLYDAGHYRSIGSAAHLRFDERNVHGQCVYCNRDLSGNIVAYRKGLIERIGLAELERLESDNTTRKWDKDELRELTAKYRKMAKELE